MAALTRRAEAELGFTQAHWIVSSFHHPELLRFKGLRPEIRIGALTASLPLDGAAFAENAGGLVTELRRGFRRQRPWWRMPSPGLKILVATVDEVVMGAPSPAWVSMASSPTGQIDSAEYRRGLAGHKEVKRIEKCGAPGYAKVHSQPIQGWLITITNTMDL